MADLIGTTEAAEILRVSPRTVTRWANAGDLKVAHLATGGRHGAMLFDRADVEQLDRDLDASTGTA